MNMPPFTAHDAADYPAPVLKRPPKLLEQVREAIRVRHYSIRTEKPYVSWIRRYILFHGKRHAVEMGGAEVTAFLTGLAGDGGVAAATEHHRCRPVPWPAQEPRLMPSLVGMVPAPARSPLLGY